MHVPARMAQTDHATRQRQEHQALRWRMLYGCWSEDLRRELQTQLGSERAAGQGSPDTSSSLLMTAAQAVATLYDGPPQVHHAQPAVAAVVQDLLDDAGWQSVGQRLQRDTIAIRDHLLYVRRSGPRIVLRSVPPHEVEEVADLTDPERPVMIGWWQLRDDRWTREIWDIRPGRERYVVEDDRGADLSAVYIRSADGSPAPAGGYRGDAYPYRLPSGEAYLPWVHYRAARAGQWDYMTASEAVWATLRLGVYWTMWGHLLSDASWAQRYLIGGEVVGQMSVGDGPEARTVVVADPAVLLRIVRYEGGGEMDASPTIHQDEAPGDPLTVGQAITAYERRIVASLGLNPADVGRIDGDPRSGYALAVTRDGQREAQRRYEPIFRRWDAHLAGVVGALMGLPSSGYRISYQSIPPAIGELLQLQAYVDREIAAGRMTRAGAYRMMHPGLSEADAIAALDAISTAEGRADGDRDPGDRGRAAGSDDDDGE